jgi:methionine aminopeptidase type II
MSVGYKSELISPFFVLSLPVLQKSDVLKVDIGVQVQGRICDSAFTLTFEETHNPLLEAVRAATETGVREAGIDARLGEIGAAIQETMESHEYEVNGKTLQVKCVQNLNGHNIGRYTIHKDKSVPIVAQPQMSTKMEEGEYFAIETFGSTGKGYVVDCGDCSHYARRANVGNPTLRVASARPLLHTINKQFGTLPFCRRYLDRVGEKNYLLGLKHLVSQGIVQDYPPLADIAGVGAQTAQFEHTILLKPTGKGESTIRQRGGKVTRMRRAVLTDTVHHLPWSHRDCVARRRLLSWRLLRRGRRAVGEEHTKKGRLLGLGAQSAGDYRGSPRHITSII